MNRTQGHPPLWLAWPIWGIGVLFYVMGFFQRVAPAVMTSELMADFGIGAAALGHLSAFYYYAYVAMQIPTGILVDAWGPRRLLTAGTAAAAAGTMLFALAPGIFWADLGRLLIGGSVAVAFVASLKLASNWLPSHVFAMASGLALASGSAGAVLAGAPLRMLVNHFGWRSVSLASGLITLALVFIIWIFVRDDPSEKGYASYAPAPSARTPSRKSATPLLGLCVTYSDTATHGCWFWPREEWSVQSWPLPDCGGFPI